MGGFVIGQTELRYQIIRIYMKLYHQTGYSNIGYVEYVILFDENIGFSVSHKSGDMYRFMRHITFTAEEISLETI